MFNEAYFRTLRVLGTRYLDAAAAYPGGVGRKVYNLQDEASGKNFQVDFTYRKFRETETEDSTLTDGLWQSFSLAA